MNSSKKLIYIANLRLPTEKAYGIQITKMCEAFASQDGLDVTLVYPFRKNLEKGDIFSYYSLKNNFKAKEVMVWDFYLPGFLNKVAFLVKNYFSAKELVKEALRENADVYYTREELVAYLLSKHNKNVVFECHRFSNKRKFFYSHFKKINLKIVAISDGLKQDLMKFGIKDSNVSVARDGVDPGEFGVLISGEKRKEIQKKLREEFFTDHNDRRRRKKIAVYIGSLYPWKGVDILIKVAEHLKDINPNYLIWIVGGSKNDVEVLKKGLHPNIVPFIYVNGAVPHKEVAKILIVADCAILTGKEDKLISAKYTSPLKMFEYMASGCPIVAQKLPSFLEVLNNQNSILVKPGDPKELADGIYKIFKSLDDYNPEEPELPERISKKAFEDVQKYSWNERAKKILTFSGFLV